MKTTRILPQRVAKGLQVISTSIWANKPFVVLKVKSSRLINSNLEWFLKFLRNSSNYSNYVIMFFREIHLQNMVLK